MIRQLRATLIMLSLCAFSPSYGALEFDSKANKVLINGPYLKYNVLAEPYSLGRYYFELNDIRLQVASSAEAIGAKPPAPAKEATQQKKDDDEKTEDSAKTETTAESSAIAFSEQDKVFAIWPRFFLEFGRIQLIDDRGRQFYSNTFRPTEIGTGERFARYELEGEDEDLLEVLQEPFKICLEQQFEFSYVKVCSNRLQYKNGQFDNAFTGKNAASTRLNKKRTPKNSQITLSTKTKQFELEIKFKSGFSIYIRDKARHLGLKNIIIDPAQKRIGVVAGDGSVRPRSLTMKDRFFEFIEEENYFRNQTANDKEWPQDLENAEMEFAPYLTGASALLYGIILQNAPPPFQFKLNDNAPIGTYTSMVELKGTKQENEVLAARVENELFIHNNQRDFLWAFPAPEKAAINQNYLSLQHKGKDYYFSQRVFRSHSGNISASAALSTSPTLEVVPGYNFAGEYWFEELWDKSKWSFQRWGISANLYETLQGFKPEDDFPEKISVNPSNVDILFRFTPGIRPVQSSFGVGLRYLNFRLNRSINENIETRYLGIGAFWHTAPQKIIDDVFNVVPWFRYPKWMEISLFYYPLLLGPQELGFSFSWQARGKMFFSRNWFLDASFNVTSIQFSQFKIRGVTPGADSFGIATAHGTIGLGYLFN